MLAVWPTRSLCKGLHAAGKRPGGVWQGQQTPLQSTVHPICITVAAVRTEAASIKGVLGGVETAMMLDSGSSIFLIQKDVISHTRGVTRVRPIPQLRLKTASGEPLPVRDFVCTQVHLGQLKVKHSFIAVDRLVAHVILGVDFLQKSGLTLDFTTKPVTVCSSSKLDVNFSKISHTPVLPAAFHPTQRKEAHIMAIAVEDEASTDIVDECAVPSFGDTQCYELPECPQPSLAQTVQANQNLFRTTPGAITEAYHYIPTTRTSVHVPPRCIPAHYRTEVESQIQDMLRQDIIEESCSPWMAPAVFDEEDRRAANVC